MKKRKSNYIMYVIIVLVILLSVLNIYFITIRNHRIEEAARDFEAVNEPAKIQIIKISASNCTDCFSVDSVIESLRNNDNINITSQDTLESSSVEAIQIIEIYGIERLPTLLVLGEIGKSKVVGLWGENWVVKMENDKMTSAFFVGLSPPYYDLKENSIVGMVSLTQIVDESCTKCPSFSQIIDSLKQNGVKFSEENTIDYTSHQAAELISDFGIQRIPTIIVSKDIVEYPSVAQIWEQLNVTGKNGFYALHAIPPPYRDLLQNKIVGLVDAIYLNDSSCPECYDVTIHGQIISGLGVIVEREEFIDVGSEEGKLLINKYNITKVPSIILSPEANVYQSLNVAWQQVGTIENDSYYVFRKPELMNVIYKDLTIGEIVGLPPQQ